jgi:lipoprotein-anchoring transpeptidase ErfK/SrfK
LTNPRSPVAVPRPTSRHTLAALACLVALAAAGCVRGPATSAGAGPPQTAPAPAVTEPPVAADGRVGLGDAAAYAAIARGEVTVRSKPAGGSLDRLPATLSWGTPTPFLVREARRVDGQLWYRVLLPKRPNESTGWVRGDQVRTAARSYSAEVDLSARRLTLYRGTDAVRTFPVAIGQPDTPTPTGRFFVTVKLRPPQISRVYGAWALGLSAYSEVFDQFGTGDGQIALHGTNDGSELGQAVSHGCVRLSNPSISLLASLLPPGSPVDIRA